MKLVIGDFEIEFEYYDYTNEPLQVGPDAFASHVVECTLYDAYYDEEARGLAYCSVNDEYSALIGREKSLERALENLPNPFDPNEPNDCRVLEDIWEMFYEAEYGSEGY